jgi:hypothetical protein
MEQFNQDKWVQHTSIPSKHKFFSSRRECSTEAYILFDTAEHASAAISNGLRFCTKSKTPEQKSFSSDDTLVLDCQTFKPKRIIGLYDKHALSLSFEKSRGITIDSQMTHLQDLFKRLNLPVTLQQTEGSTKQYRGRHRIQVIGITTYSERVTSTLYTLFKQNFKDNGGFKSLYNIDETVTVL